MPTNNEKVLVIPTYRLQNIGMFQGFTGPWMAGKIFNSVLTKFEFLPRSQVEDDPAYKQIIPYVIVQYQGPDKDSLILSYTRGKSGGEDRLKQLKSIGIGGHISESVLQDHAKINMHRGLNETRSREFLYTKIEAEREIDEEISIQSKKIMYLCGFVNDDSNAVGRVHLGVVYRLLIQNPEVTPKEDAIAKMEMVRPKQLIESIDEYESWSRIIIGSMFK